MPFARGLPPETPPVFVVASGDALAASNRPWTTEASVMSTAPRGVGWGAALAESAGAALAEAAAESEAAGGEALAELTGVAGGDSAGVPPPHARNAAAGTRVTIAARAPESTIRFFFMVRPYLLFE
jgi:hypothetical protein